MICGTLSSQDACTHQIWDSYHKWYERYALATNILKTRSEVKVTVTQRWYATLRHPKMHPDTPNFGFLSQIIQEICSGNDYSKNYVRGPGHSDPKMVCDTLPSQDAVIQQIWNSCLKEYRRYASDSMPILETRSEVKVIVTQGWYAALCHPKMHAHTKFGIPTSNNIRDMLRIRIFLKLGQGHSDPKMVCGTPPPQDAYTHQIWDSCLWI